MTAPTRVKRPAFQWYPGDHRRDTALQACSFEARALWREMLDLMHDGEPYGHLTAGGDPIDVEGLARIIGKPRREVSAWLAELERRKIFSRTEHGVIYSRRMTRDEHNRNVRAAGGSKSLDNPNVPQPKEPAKERPKDRAKDDTKDRGKDTSSGSFGGSPAFASAVAVAYASKSGADAERSLRGSANGAAPQTDRTAPPASAVESEAATSNSAHNDALGFHARRLVNSMPHDKRADGERQLLDLLGEGTILDGERVVAVDAAHIEAACLAKLSALEGVRNRGLLARFAVQQVQKTYGEVRADREKAAEQRIAPAVAALLQPSVDELTEAYRWIAELPDEKRALEEEAEQRYAGFPQNAGMLRQHSRWIDEQVIARWKSATHATANGGERP